ncbi:MAG TPA: YHS domain-containing (seleno)protein [Ohtaekwangia sp.]|uniref:YHS domain-containing (seleno)protein n=1 Tax=Ohtaekwangia sp. TaxID=2066019 RepID=UPI002F92936F
MKTIMKWVGVIMLMGSTFAAFSQVEPVGKDHVAIGGYDVVAYFKDGKAVKGSADIQATYNTVIYYFSTARNREEFLKQPLGYLPQYDGYCALAVGAQNKKVSINPETFKVTDGKLYLFYNGKLPFSGAQFNSLEPWNKDETGLIKKADANWPALKASRRR